MLPLLSGLNAVVDYMVVDGSVTNELMAVFAREVMVRGARVAMLSDSMCWHASAHAAGLGGEQCKHVGPGDVVVLDNWVGHNSAYFKALVRSTGATLAYNAPYSPDLNPVRTCLSSMHTLAAAASVSQGLLRCDLLLLARTQVEHCFGQMKSWFKKHDALARRSTTEFMIQEALRHITPANVHGYVQHDWRAFWDPQ